MKMTNKPFLSICVATYNQSEYFNDVLSYLLKQTYNDYEIVISDDSTDDKTEKLISEYNDPRIRYYHNIKSLGRVCNYRRLVDLARGEWVLMHDGDDLIIDFNHLENSFEIIRNNEGLAFVQAGVYVGSELSKSYQRLPNIHQNEVRLSGYDYLTKFIEIEQFSHLATIFNKQIALQVIPYSLNIISSDIHTMLRMAAHGDVYLIKKAVGFWRKHEKNTSLNASLYDKILNLKWVSDVIKYWVQLGKLSKSDSNRVYKLLFSDKLSYITYKYLIENHLNFSIIQFIIRWFKLFAFVKLNYFLIYPTQRNQIKSIIYKRLRR